MNFFSFNINFILQSLSASVNSIPNVIKFKLNKKQMFICDSTLHEILVLQYYGSDNWKNFQFICWNFFFEKKRESIQVKIFFIKDFGWLENLDHNNVCWNLF